MPRKSRKRPMDGRLGKLVSKYVSQLVDAIGEEVRQIVSDQVRGMLVEQRARVGSAPLRARRRRILPCIAPNCRNTSKGPRFHYLCDSHMDASKKDYTTWREARKERAKAA